MSGFLILDTDVASYLFKNSLKHYEAAETLCGLQLLRAQST